MWEGTLNQKKSHFTEGRKGKTFVKAIRERNCIANHFELKCHNTQASYAFVVHDFHYLQYLLYKKKNWLLIKKFERFVDLTDLIPEGAWRWWKQRQGCTREAWKLEEEDNLSPGIHRSGEIPSHSSNRSLDTPFFFVFPFLTDFDFNLMSPKKFSYTRHGIPDSNRVSV